MRERDRERERERERKRERDGGLESEKKKRSEEREREREGERERGRERTLKLQHGILECRWNGFNIASVNLHTGPVFWEPTLSSGEPKRSLNFMQTHTQPPHTPTHTH